MTGKSFQDVDFKEKTITVCNTRTKVCTEVNISTLSHKFRKMLEKKQMPHIRFHDIRHSVASYLLKNGVSLKEIQLWCGHSDISVTAMFYTHVDIEMKRCTGNKINELFAS